MVKAILHLFIFLFFVLDGILVTSAAQNLRRRGKLLWR